MHNMTLEDDLLLSTIIHVLKDDGCTVEEAPKPPSSHTTCHLPPAGVWTRGVTHAICCAIY